jgi:hypothetical protein
VVAAGFCSSLAGASERALTTAPLEWAECLTGSGFLAAGFDLAGAATGLRADEPLAAVFEVDGFRAPLLLVVFVGIRIVKIFLHGLSRLKRLRDQVATFSSR